MKKVLMLFLIITGFLFISCSDFLQGSNLKEQIEKEIEIANTPGIILAVNPLIPESIVNLTPSGNLEVKKGKKINIEATINNNYTFVEWRVYSKSKGTLFDLKDVKLKFDETITNYIGSSVIVSTIVEILDVQNDLEIVPFCKIKTDTLPPAFVGDFKVSYSKEQLNKGNNFNLAEYDENGKLIYKTANRAAKLYFDFLAEDLDKPSKIWIQETRLFAHMHSPVNPDSESAEKYQTVIENCFTPYQKTVHKAAFTYEFKTEDDVPVLIEVKLIDESGNISDGSRKIVVAKDTKVSIDSFPIASMIEESSLKETVEDKTNRLGKLFIPQIVDGYFDGEDDVYEPVSEFDVSWGYTKECAEGKTHISESAKSIERYTYKINNDLEIQLVSVNEKGYLFDLPENVIRQDSNLYLSVTATDSVGNTTTVTTCLYSAPIVKNVAITKYNDSYKYQLLIDYDDMDYEDVQYIQCLVYVVSEDSSYLKECYRNNLSTLIFSLDVDYDSINAGEKICDIYLQHYTNQGQNALGGQISKYTLTKGELLNEEGFESEGNFNLEDYCKYEVESITAVDTGNVYNTIVCKIELPEELLNKYNWSFFAAMSYNDYLLSEINDYKVNTASVIYILATAYDEYGIKKISQKYYINVPDTLDVKGPQILFSGSDLYRDYYNNFSVENYAGSGIRVTVFDDNGLQKDSRSVSYANLQVLPSDYFSSFWDFYKEGYDNYPYHPIYKHDINEDFMDPHKYQDLVVPLYVLSKDECNLCVLEMIDDTSHKNINKESLGFIRWDTIEEKTQITIVDKKADISLVTDLSDYTIDAVGYYDHYSVNLEYYDEGLNSWRYAYSDREKLESNSFQYEKKSYLLKENCFYRLRASVVKQNNINFDSWMPKFDVLFTKPEYFSSSKESCNNKLMIQGTNGIQISYDMPVLVQTYYAEKNLGSKLSDWELQAPDINTKLYEPVSNGTACVSEYYYDAVSAPQQVPEGYYYIVAAYFSDGTSTCTSVLQK